MDEGLPARTRKVIRCAIRLHRRVTAADVALATGLSLNDAETELVRLTSKVGGHLEVSKQGDIVYAFPLGFRQALVLNPIEAGVRKFAVSIGKSIWWVCKMYFGTLLIISICVLFLIVLIFLARFFENVDFGGGGGWGGSGGGSDKKKSKKKQKSTAHVESQERKKLTHSQQFSELRHLYTHKLAEVGQIDLNSLKVAERSVETTADGAGGKSGINVPAFFKEVFSYLFGDEDPNQSLEDERWSKIAQLILARHGVLTAEELAPYLDVDPAKLGDEKFVLPVLARFKGRARITESGHMVYVFEPSNVSAVSSPSETGLPEFLQESKWTITYPWHVAALVIVNVGLAILALPLSMGLSPWLIPVTLILFLNSLFFVGLNIWTKSQVAWKNVCVDSRNDRRLQCINYMLDPKNEIEHKLREAAAFRTEKTIISEQDIVYRTDADIVEQSFEMKPGVEAETAAAAKRQHAKKESSSRTVASHGVAAGAGVPGVVAHSQGSKTSSTKLTNEPVASLPGEGVSAESDILEEEFVQLEARQVDQTIQLPEREPQQEELVKRKESAKQKEPAKQEQAAEPQLVE